MSLGQFNPGFVSVIAFLSASLAIFLWWLQRLRQQSRPFPLVKIFKAKRLVLPPLKLKRPCWPPFLLFLCLCICFCLLSLRPTLITYKPLESKKATYHLYVDMSPSVAASTSLEDYAAQVSGLWAALPRGSTLSTSHTNAVWSPSDATELRTKLLALGFHRAGSQLAHSLQAQQKKVGPKDHFIIFADRDRHTWQGFTWQYFQKEHAIWFYDLTARPPAANLYLVESLYRSAPDSALQDWDVTLARTGSAETLRAAEKGKLLVSYGEKTLAQENWQFAPGQKELTLRVSWPRFEPKAAAKTTEPDPLVWQLQPTKPDSLVSDNTLRSAFGGERQTALIVAQPAGEQKLAAPALAIHTSLEALGFSPTRFEEFPSPDLKPLSYPLWILFVGQGSEGAGSCPYRTLPKADAALQIWLSPYSNNGKDLSALCSCYYHLLQAQPDARLPEATAPPLCQEVSSREALAAALQALGAQQIGGELGASQQALAWVGSHSKSQLGVLAFSLALRPLADGLTHSSLPLVVRELLRKEGFALLAHGPKPAPAFLRAWQRLSDHSSSHAWREPEQASARELSALALSNVPLEESLLQAAAAKTLPPLWPRENAPDLSTTLGQLSPHQKQPDPLPWLQTLALCVFLCCVGEILWYSRKTLVNFFSRTFFSKKGPLTFYIFALFAPAPESPAINLNLVGFPPIVWPLDPLRNAVAERTSLQLDRELLQSSSVHAKQQGGEHDALNSPSLQEPWLWAANLDAVSTKQGKLLPELQTWLRRGGFLILEGSLSSQALNQLTATGLAGEATSGLWSSITPDHELMRSFYLLQALPLCGPQTWQGYQFDQRLAILVVPPAFLASLLAPQSEALCPEPSAAARIEPHASSSREEKIRIFINILMVALTTDYKKDQIHLRAILKRLQ